MKTIFVDSKGVEYVPDKNNWKPADGLFQVKHGAIRFPLKMISVRPATMWRYQEALPVSEKISSSLSLGEGMTPLVPFDDQEPNLWVKMDYLMPTGSFKDRGAAVLIAKAKELGVTSVIADSSGNAATSIAAYSARAGIECHVFVPDSVSEKKLAQVKAHGAIVHKIAGTREETAVAAQSAVEETDAFYASHVYNPFFHEGTKTFSFEIWEQLQFKVPDQIILPVGNGTLLLGAYIGFTNLLNAGMIDKLPKLVAVQAENCAPLAHAFTSSSPVTSVENEGTAAEGIAIADPARGEQIIQAVHASKGTIITAPEEDIDEAKAELAKKGFYVEPTTAATYAAYKKYKIKHVTESERVVIALCGSGLKK
ncbi:threonine synthase [Halobacillus rhizosphaerae]|uniref:threonine synthase n=1 Tax=Halobacillus rhizosphaerae TaxID=3064889 RepID=UPI00398AFE32